MHQTTEKYLWNEQNKNFKKTNIVILSIDPTENIDTFMKRIKFRKKYGPLLNMKKNI